ncbi:porin family protein [soil metagenome]
MKMIKPIFAIVGLTAALISNAQAAELQSPQNASPVVARYSPRWSGFYAGVSAGGGFGNTSIVTTGQATANVNNVNGGARPALTSVDRQGVLGGGQIGYNHQLGKLVLGLETDFSGSSINGQRTVVTTTLTGGASLNNNYSSSLTYLGTVRGRVGYTFGRTLIYGTGGYAYGKSEHSANLFGPSPANVLQFTGSSNSLKSGFVAGGGLEYAMARKLSVKGEYLYYGLGSDTLNVAVITGSGGGGTGYNTRFENHGNLLRLGLNYRF